MIATATAPTTTTTTTTNGSNSGSGNSENALFAQKLHLKLKTLSISTTTGTETEENNYYNNYPSEMKAKEDESGIGSISSPELSSENNNNNEFILSRSFDSEESSDNSIYFDCYENNNYFSSSINNNEFIGGEFVGSYYNNNSVVVVPEIKLENCYYATPTKNNEEEKETTKNEEQNNKLYRIQRSSSLKTGKTPPGTPGRKKIVRFADVLGLDLADVKLFFDGVPKVPRCAWRDLTASDLEDAEQEERIKQKTNAKNSNKPTLLPTFHQPVSQPDFFDRIRDQKVLLENAWIENDFIRGTVRVKNEDFHKSVYVRYSTDDWVGFFEVMATYIPGTCDGFSDRFEFRLPTSGLIIGQKLSFACRFHSLGNQYWDNNLGRNYSFHSVPCNSGFNSSSSCFF